MLPAEILSPNLYVKSSWTESYAALMELAGLWSNRKNNEVEEILLQELLKKMLNDIFIYYVCISAENREVFAQTHIHVQEFNKYTLSIIWIVVIMV